MAHEENLVIPDTSWDRCASHYSQPPIYIKYVHSMLAAGTFGSVCYEKEGEQETNKIFRIVSYEATTVTLNKFVPFAVSNLLSRAPIAEGRGCCFNKW
jgi:hypothetical protein